MRHFWELFKPKKNFCFSFAITVAVSQTFFSMYRFFRVVPDAEVESEDNDDLQIVEDVIDVEEKKSLVLAPYEAFFLAFGLGCLLVRDEKSQEMSIDALWTRFNDVNPGS